MSEKTALVLFPLAVGVSAMATAFTIQTTINNAGRIKQSAIDLRTNIQNVPIYLRTIGHS